MRRTSSKISTRVAAIDDRGLPDLLGEATRLPAGESEGRATPTAYGRPSGISPDGNFWRVVMCSGDAHEATKAMAGNVARILGRIHITD